MAELDPYFRNSLDAHRQVVLAARPIIIAQDGSDQDGVVQIAANRDIVVIADEVAVRGCVLARRAPADGVIAGPAGCTLLILARRVDTIAGKDADARLDVSGGEGVTSTRIWTAPAAIGNTGPKGHSIWHPITDDVAAGGTGGGGDNGNLGDPGGAGGKGGTVDLRFGFAAPTLALAVVADGGPGGKGQDGQEGGPGGKGGDGADSENYWLGNRSAATEGGQGGPGGNAGDGGAPGAGGAPGMVRIRLRNTPSSGVTSSLQAGMPGAAGGVRDPGSGGLAGQGGRPWGRTGLGGPGGNSPESGWLAGVGDLGPGPKGDKGTKLDELKQDKGAAPDVVGTCNDADLVTSLSFPVTVQTAMLLDRIQVDHLAATGSVDPTELSDLADRIDWVSTLLGAYAPTEAVDIGELDAQRAAAQVVSERFRAARDFYGNAADYVPLGSIATYRQRFDNALDALKGIQSECDERVTALEQASRTASDLDQAKRSLATQQGAYDAAATTERAAIADLVTQINTADEEMLAAKQMLVGSSITAFENAVIQSCGISANDLIDTIGQLAFLGEKQFQESAMVLGQALKLGETAASKVLAADGTAVDKDWVINELQTTDLSTAKLKAIVGGKSGVTLSDPGAVKLLAQQSEFDQLCDKFWNVSGAAAAKADFDDYVSAVQTRNAHVLTLNESLARLRAYVAGGAQTAAALATAQTQSAAASDAGVVVLVAQLTRMSARARAACIEALYLASRAYSFWALEPADALAAILSDLSAGRPLAMTPTALLATGEQLLTRFSNAANAKLGERPISFPPVGGSGQERGKMIEFTLQSHPTLFNRLRTRGSGSFQLVAPRAHTTSDENSFAGLSDVRLSSVRCWLSGVGWSPGHGPTVRVDLEHLGRETLIRKDGFVHVLRHEPVHIVMEYDSTRPVDPAGVVAASDLQDGDADTVGALIGPFARWRMRVSPELNPGVDLSAVDKITIEMHIVAQSFGMPTGA